ncbi:hypothetical protein DSCW_27220 [Desulfosarcina widdelii]|uniref:Uncharacterized protein n=1 Tax=Desulfosarcina widdelii TaxID=947919 RepID=A0A5K7Z3K9_9BACT|nr:hypothetical protein [Desulfosarcina widdelii]BBO75305.1 hypothetical protein DSCW_27220 [Desulfosarcina widdelii]
MRMENDYKGDIQKHKRKPASTEEILQEALAERARFLKKRPHMKAYQKEIDHLLDKSGSHQGRLAVLGTLMQSKLLDIQKELFTLNKIIQISIS